MEFEPLPYQLKRFNDLQKMLSEKRKLGSDEYLALLLEIQSNYTIALAMRAAIGSAKDSGKLIHVLDKIHWLIDSATSKEIRNVDKDQYVVNVHFTHIDDPDKTKK